MDIAKMVIGAILLGLTVAIWFPLSIIGELLKLNK